MIEVSIRVRRNMKKLEALSVNPAKQVTHGCRLWASFSYIHDTYMRRNWRKNKREKMGGREF